MTEIGAFDGAGKGIGGKATEIIAVILPLLPRQQSKGVQRARTDAEGKEIGFGAGGIFEYVVQKSDGDRRFVLERRGNGKRMLDIGLAALVDLPRMGGGDKRFDATDEIGIGHN